MYAEHFKKCLKVAFHKRTLISSNALEISSNLFRCSSKLKCTYIKVQMFNVQNSSNVQYIFNLSVRENAFLNNGSCASSHCLTPFFFGGCCSADTFPEHPRTLSVLCCNFEVISNYPSFCVKVSFLISFNSLH